MFGLTDEEHATKVYKMYFVTGLILTSICLALVMLYVVFKHVRKHPMNILFNILILQLLVSIRYLVIGSVFKAHNNDLDWSPFSNRDFGFMSYDCKIEGMISYTVYVMIIMWNFVWTYDIYVTVNKPLVFTEKYSFYYKIAVYFSSLIFALVIFFPNIDKFAETDTF